MGAAPSNEGGESGGAAVARLADPSEQRLIDAARAGERSAFASLVERHHGRVWSLALRLCRGRREEAEDLAQEAFLRALQAIASFRGEAAFATWIHRIVVNLYLNGSATLAARARARQLSLDGNPLAEAEHPAVPSAPTVDPADALAEADELARLRGALDRLGEPWRTVVVLRDVEGQSYEEIAFALAVPIGTVRSRLARAREQIARALGVARREVPGGAP